MNVKSPIYGTAYHFDEGNTGYGQFVVVVSSDGGCHVLAHLSSFDSVISEDETNQGVAVSFGEVIGIEGGTGSANGAIHLHWEIQTVCRINLTRGSYSDSYPHDISHLTTNYIDPHLWQP